MRKFTLTKCFFAFLFFLLKTTFLFSQTTHTVCASGCDYLTIQAANDAAAANDIISIEDETHTERGITLNKSLTIQGNHPSGTTVQAHAQESVASDRVFNITSGNNVLIKDLTIQHGYLSGTANHKGAGIHNEGTLTMNQVHVIKNNIVSDGEVRGGGIYSTGKMTMTNCDISNNEITSNLSNTYGAGISVDYQADSLLISNCTVSNNINTNYRNGTGANIGGGIFSFADNTIISYSTISYNKIVSWTLTSWGGGVCTYKNLILNNNTFAVNQIVGDSISKGGGVFSSGTATITNNTFWGNSCRKFSYSANGGGGGVSLYQLNHASTYSYLYNNTFSQNSAAQGKGIEAVQYTGSVFNNYLHLTNNIINDGIEATNIVTNQTNICKSCSGTWYSTTDPYLGSIQDNGGSTETLAINSHCSAAIDAGTATGAPTLDQRDSSRVGVIDIGAVEYETTFNKTLYSVCASGCDFTSIKDVLCIATPGDTILLNDALYTEYNIRISTDLVIIGNHPSGSIIQAAATPLTAPNKIFTINSGNVAMSNLTLRNGKSTYNGGAIHNDGTLELTNCIISNNWTKYKGGGIFSSGSLTLTNCSIFENTADQSSGGGIYSGGILSLTNCTIAENIGDYVGGLHGLDSDSKTVINCTISNNTHTDPSGYNVILSEPVHMTNTIIENDSGLKNYSYFGGAGLATNNNNICEGCIGGYWYSTADPMIDTLADNGGTTPTIAFSSNNSPAINAGTITNAPTMDQRGNPRYEAPDIGAYEYCGCTATSPVAVDAGTYTSICSTTDGDWKHFCDATGKLLLSLNIGTSGAEIPEDGVTVEIGNGTNDYFVQGCGASPACFIDMPKGAVMLNRRFDINPTTQPAGEVGVKFYFTQTDYDALNARLNDVGQSPLTSIEDLWFYNIINTSLPTLPDISTLVLNDIQILENDTTSAIDKWSLDTLTVGSEYFAAYQLSTLNTSGGIGSDLLPNQVANLTVCETGCDYTTIANAVNAARSYLTDTITVMDAVHTEEGILIDKNVVVRSGIPAGTIVQANATEGIATNRVFTIATGVTTSFQDLTIQHGNATASGGGISNEGFLTLTNCTVKNNTAFGDGGGIYSASKIIIDQCMISENTAENNTAEVNGGGIYFTDSLTIMNSTISGNACNYTGTTNTISALGGGISTLETGVGTLENCTVANNSCSSGGDGAYGGGVYSRGDLTIINCTVAANTLTATDNTLVGSGIRNNGTLSLTNTIIANNTGGENYEANGTLTTNDNNICEACTTETWVSTIDPLLNPLADNGGSTWTISLKDCSDALNSGTPTNIPTNDQRGLPRFGIPDIGAYEHQVADNCVPGKLTVCASGCDYTTITGALVDARTYMIDTISVMDAVHTEVGVLVNKTVVIQGGNAGGTIVQAHATEATAADRVFTIAAGVSVSIFDMTIQHGNATASGGGISNEGFLTLTNCTVKNNTAFGDGGGIYSASKIIIDQCMISENTAQNNTTEVKGGGIYFTDSLTIMNSTISANACNYTGTINTTSALGGGISTLESGVGTLENCTVANNACSSGGDGAYGGGVYSRGDLTIINCTIAANTLTATGNTLVGGGIRNNGTLSLTNTIVANNTGGENYEANGTLTTNNNTICEACTSETWFSTLNPVLGTLADNGGNTMTMSLLDCSPALDAGTSSGISPTDQRGLPRFGNADIGAFEKQTADGCTPATLTVCASGCGYTTIAAAMVDAQFYASDTILLMDAVHTEQGIIVDKQVVIKSGNIAGTIVQANASQGTATDRVFRIQAGITVFMFDLTIQHGNLANWGGGILNLGELILENCTVQKNNITAGSGGGIYNNNTLTMKNCTLSENEATNAATAQGGGLYSSSTATLINVTLAENTIDCTAFSGAWADGGGVYTSGILTLINCTVANNTSTSTSGQLYGSGVSDEGTLHLTNTIIANNTGANNYEDYGTLSTNEKNICESCGTPDVGTWVSTADPMIGTLADNGGDTKTIAITDKTSLAINAGTSTGALLLDQRGYERNYAPDIGAYEFCDCSSSHTVATATGTYNSVWSVVEDDWKYYCDIDGKLLLSLQAGASGAVINSDEVSLQIGSNTTDYHTQFCGASPACFIDIPEGAVTFNRSWDVQPTMQPNNGNVGVKFYFTQMEYDSVNARLADLGQAPLTGFDQLWFYKVTNGSLGQFPLIENITGGDLIVIENDATTPTDDQWVFSTKTASSEYIATYEVSSFSGGGGGGAEAGKSPLPIELIYFHAYKVEEEVQLKWSTASEINNRGFEILRSENGRDWKTLGFVDGVGNSTVTNYYAYLDESPNAGINYYRLKQIDMNGKEELLPIRSVDMGRVISEIEIYPNPTSQFLNITNAKGNAKIYNLSGQLEMEIELSEEGINSINVDELNEGMYHLYLIKENGQRVIERFSKVSIR